MYFTHFIVSSFKKKLALNCASQVAIKTIVKPKMEKNRKFRWQFVSERGKNGRAQSNNPRFLDFSHSDHVFLIVPCALLFFFMASRDFDSTISEDRLDGNMFAFFIHCTTLKS